MISASVLEQAAVLLARLHARGWLLATAESCTGGLIAAALTHVAGSSAVVDRGFVTYSNEAKAEMLDVPPALIAAHGAVSEPVAAAMAAGALMHSRADVAVAVTGIAGPGGGSLEKPVGLVWFACAVHGAAGSAPCSQTAAHVFPGDRAEVRSRTVAMALAMLTQAS